jgi:eukaryotic-like serine/threonine-protein kinase
MSEPGELCASCGTTLTSPALAGSCLRCLGKAAFGTHVEASASGSGESPRTRFLGGYELLAEIGRGGMGVVYRARQAGLGREVALKVLAAGPYADAVDVARFRAEAAATAALHHPGIVTVFEVGEADGHPYFSMELVQGTTLASLTVGAALEPRRAARYAKSVAEAVGAAHARGILHRDLKPGNVMIDLADEARVTDFGLARELGSKTTQHIVGSPGYMPPEQADPLLGGIGVASDVYGLGALLYHLLTARPPFNGSTVTATLAQVMTKEPERPSQINSQVPEDLETICLKCLSKEPSRRYASAREVAEELEAFLARRPIKARPVGAPERLWLWSRRRPGLAMMSGLAAMILAGGLAAFLWQSRENHFNLYAADLRIAAEDIEHGDLTRARTLLARHAPIFGSAPFTWRYLRQRSEGDPRTLLGQHPWIVTSMAWSPNGNWIASGSVGSGTIGADLRLWRVAAPAPPLILTTNHIRAIQWFPDNRRLLAVGASSGAGIWDVLAKRELTNYPASTAQISKDGTRLVTCEGDAVVWNANGPDGTVWLRELNSGQARRFPNARLAALSPSGKKLALSDIADKIDIFDVDSAVLEHRLSGSGKVWAMVFSDDDRSLVVTGFEADVRVWLLDGGQVVMERWSGHSLPTWQAAFSPDGTRLLTTSSDETVRLWETRSGTPLEIFRGHGSEVWCAAFSPDGRQFATGGKDRNVFIWPASKPPSPTVIKARDWGRRFFSVDSHHLVAISADDPPRALVHGLKQDAPIQAFNTIEPMAIDAAGSLLLRRTPFTLEWVDTYHQQPTRQVILEHDVSEKPPQLWDASSDGGVLAGLSPEKRLSTWDSRTGRRITMLPVPVGEAWALALSPDHHWVALTLGENGFLLCSLREQNSQRLTGHLDQGKWATFSPDSHVLATASSDATIKLWAVPSGRELATLRGHLTGVSGVAIAPDGRTLVSLEPQQGLRFWDLPTLREVAIVPLPTAGEWLGFSPDGQTLAVNLNDGGVCLLKAP